MRILHVIKTARYESDGRLLKWIDSLEKSGHTSSVFLIEDDNSSGDSLRGSVLIHKENLWFRKVFKKHSGLFFKTLEQAWKWRKYLYRSDVDVLVFHDVQQYLNIYIALTLLKKGRKKEPRIIWDLHELPHVQLGSNYLTKRLLGRILSQIDLLVYTNDERRLFIKETYGHNEKEFAVLNNFPDESFISARLTQASGELDNWGKQENKPYLLWMGAASRGRYFNVLLAAYKKFKDQLNLVVMGRIEKEFKEETDLYRQEGRLFNRFVAQNEVIGYVDNAFFSVVLYNARKANNRLCEPNRLFQLLGRNIPVITGNNPTMKSWVERVNGGIVLDDDGQNVVLLENAIQKMLTERQIYSDALQGVNKLELFNWESQFSNIIEFINNK